MSIGSRIREARMALGISQAELAARAGTSASRVCNWENCRTEPMPTSLAPIAKALGVTMDWLCGVEGGESHAPEPLAVLHEDDRHLIQRLVARLARAQ